MSSMPQSNAGFSPDFVRQHAAAPDVSIPRTSSHPLLTSSSGSVTHLPRPHNESREYPHDPSLAASSLPKASFAFGGPPFAAPFASLALQPGAGGLESEPGILQQVQAVPDLPTPSQTSTGPALTPSMHFFQDPHSSFKDGSQPNGHVMKRSEIVTDEDADQPGIYSRDVSHPKKRMRKSSGANPPALSDEPKRTRGRPRLDPKDESPQERRRTQIRLAQRAYRTRKETAISELEAEVKELKDTNHEMVNAFQQLFDYAAQHGIPARLPEFGQKLEQCRGLVAKRTVELQSQKSDEDNPERDAEDLDAPKQMEIGESKVKVVADAPAVSLVPEAEHMQQLWSGMMASQDHNGIQSTMADPQPPSLDLAFNNEPVEYELITAPTHENASFAPSMSFGSNFMGAADYLWAPSSDGLPNHQLMGSGEGPFARRLHRYTCERAAYLLSIPNPPRDKVIQAFDHLRVNHTHEQIRDEILAMLKTMREDPSGDWRQASLHREYPLGDPSHHHGLSPILGPTSDFDERPTPPCRSASRKSGHGKLAGVNSQWYDPYELEEYLADNGIVIPPSTDAHYVEILPGPFLQGPVLAGPTTASVATMTGIDLDVGMVQPVPPSALLGSAAYSPQVPEAGRIPPAATAGSQTWPPLHAPSNLLAVGQTAASGLSSLPSYHSNHAAGFAATSAYGYPASNDAVVNSSPKRVLLNVRKYLDILITKAVCLGRTPGFRPRDIVTSFWRAVVTE
ncbi:hypothetical protein F4780DRAFT_661996 [Xylariomycetidae sp. FL0641]|nr:hypothetical protein F4780DRAFT_661996 [Xylariomycetidae sp. FL0641]